MTDLTATLAGPIRQEHANVQRALGDALRHAREAGRLLTEAKQSISHGGWMRFIEAQCGMSRSTAAGYMRVHDRWNELEPYVERVAHLPLRRALALLAQPDYPDVPANRGLIADHPDDEAVTSIIYPSADLDFVFYAVMRHQPDGSALADGGIRPILREYAMLALEQLGFPVRLATWKPSALIEQGWTFNEWLFGSEDDSRKATAERMIDNPSILTTAAEHRAWMRGRDAAKGED